jgi:sugar/nucleoside kinase (ribokinase family)
MNKQSLPDKPGKKLILGLGNLYVETNYLGIETGGNNQVDVGKEYSAPKYETHLGGSAVNFITQVNKFGLPCGIIGKCGTDDNADTLFKLFKSQGISTDLIKRSKDYQTNIDTGIVFAHSSQNIQIVAGNANQSLSLEDIDLDSPIFDKTYAVYFGGSFKQKNLWPKYPEIFKKLSGKGIKLYIDPGRVPVDANPEWVNILKDLLPMAEGYFPNDMEIQTVTGQKDLGKAINMVLGWGVKMIALKKGPDGATVKTSDLEVTTHGIKVNAINTVGAGDCFNASFISALYMGMSPLEAIKFANASAAFRVSKNYQPNINEVNRFIENAT